MIGNRRNRDACQQLSESLRRPAAESTAAPDSEPASPTIPPTRQPTRGHAATDRRPDVRAANDTGAPRLGCQPTSSRPPDADATRRPRQAVAGKKTRADGRASGPFRSTPEILTASCGWLANRSSKLATCNRCNNRCLPCERCKGSFSQLLDRIGSDQGTAANGSKPAVDELRKLTTKSEAILQEHSGRLERALWRSERTSTALYQQVIGSRMRPFDEGTQAFPRMIRDLSKTLGKQVSFDVSGSIGGRRSRHPPQVGSAAQSHSAELRRSRFGEAG